MAVYSKRDISPIQIMPPPSGGGQQQDQDQEEQQGQDQDTQTADEIDQSIEDKLSKRQDASDEEFQKSQKSQQIEPKKDARPSLKPIDTSSIKPTFSWKELIRQFVSSAALPQSTYTKPSRRAATQISIAQQTGAAAIKPGEKPGEDVYKLIMAFDSSGSMGGVIGRALAETSALLRAQRSSLNPVIGITFFSDQPIYHAADLVTNQGWTIENLSDISKRVPGSQQKPLNSILTSAMGGGTDFSSELSSQLSSAASRGYNVILFSDGDITWSNNWTNFVQLYKSNPNKVFFIADSAITFKEIAAKMGAVPRTFGHM
jgi:hypothetical protein